MNDVYEQREKQEREEKLRQKHAADQLRSDVQAVMGTDAGRRLVFGFLQDAGEGVTVYRDTPTAMAHAAGWQDGGNWWLDKVRQYCPEKETQMRAEAKRTAREAKEPDGNDD